MHIFQNRFLHCNREFKPVVLSTMNPINGTKIFLSYKGSYRILKRKSTQLKLWKFYFSWLVLVLYINYHNNPHQHISKCHFSVFHRALILNSTQHLQDEVMLFTSNAFQFRHPSQAVKIWWMVRIQNYNSEFRGITLDNPGYDRLS